MLVAITQNGQCKEVLVLAEDCDLSTDFHVRFVRGVQECLHPLNNLQEPQSREQQEKRKDDGFLISFRLFNKQGHEEEKKAKMERTTLYTLNK